MEKEKDTKPILKIGYIKWFDRTQESGIIMTPEHKEYSIHKSNIIDDSIKILKSTPFIFEELVTSNKKKAINCKIPTSLEDFLLGIELLLSKPETLTIEVEIRGESRWGNPYKRTEKRDIPNLKVYIGKIINHKTKDELFKFFSTAFDTNYEINWDRKDIINYYDLTRKSITGVEITQTEEELLEEQKLREERIKEGNYNLLNHSYNSRNKDLIEKLINYYDSKLNDDDLFDFWNDNVRKTTYYSSVKQEIGINEELLLKNKKELEVNNITKIIKYFNIKSSTLNQLIDPFFNEKIIVIDQFKKSLQIYNYLESELKPIYFELLIKSLSYNFYFEIWKKKIYFINFEKLKIDSFWEWEYDFNLPKYLYINNINDIGVQELLRIHKLNKNDNDLIKQLINYLVNSKIINENNFKCLIPILNNIEKKYSSEILDFLFIESDFENNNPLKNLNSSELMELYDFYPLEFIYDYLLGNLNFNNTHYLGILFEKFDYSDKLGLYIFNKLKEENELSFHSILFCLNYLIDNNFKYDLNILLNLFDRKIEVEKLVKIYDFSTRLNDEDKNKIEVGISKCISNFDSISIYDFLTLLKLDSKTILASVISSEFKIKKEDVIFSSLFKEKSDERSYLDAFFSNKKILKIDNNLFLKFVKRFLKNNEKPIFSFIVKNKIELYQKIIDELEISKWLIPDLIEIFEDNSDLIRPYAITGNDLDVIFWIVDNVQSKLETNKLNIFFKKHNYKYQSLFLKYFINLFYKRKISKDNLFSILNSFEIKELSSLMIKKFINSKPLDRDDLMKLMNVILKEHFILLNEINDSNEIFDNIYSIAGLVKSCDGRKKYSGLNSWKGGKEVRQYTDGEPSISFGENEGIYCEGRFWKKELFYDSGSNKPLSEPNNFYWCLNKVCVGVNNKIELNNNFSEWTLIEINEVFNIGLDRLAFVHLAGWLNRMDTIFERLKCQECKNHLRPLAYKPEILGFYAVPLFWCVDEKCSKFHNSIRFTHCRGCGKILDSRECKTCEKCKWLVCNDEGCSKCGCGANHNSVNAQYD